MVPSHKSTHIVDQLAHHFGHPQTTLFLSTFSSTGSPSKVARLGVDSVWEA